MTDKVSILDNFLPKEDFYQIQYYFLSGQDDAIDRWRWNPTITGIGSKKNEGGQFCLGIFYSNEGIRSEDKQHWHKCLPMLDAVARENPRDGKDLIWLRVKANMNPATAEHTRLGQFHSDFTFPCTTSIFYLNTNNGWTEFEDGTKATSVANRLVTFPSHMKHVGFSCTDEQVRVVINLNYIKYD